jgi:hypothetical protein
MQIESLHRLATLEGITAWLVRRGEPDVTDVVVRGFVRRTKGWNVAFKVSTTKSSMTVPDDLFSGTGIVLKRLIKYNPAILPYDTGGSWTVECGLEDDLFVNLIVHAKLLGEVTE